MAVTTSTAVALALAAASAAGNAYNTKRVADKQDNRLAAQLRDQAEKQRRADKHTNELVQKTASSNAEDERVGALDSFVRQMRATQGNATGPKVQGAVSDEYRQDAQDAALGAQGYGHKVADLLSRIDAPMQQRTNEAAESVRFGNEIDQIKRFSAGDDYLHKLKLGGIRRNPYIDAGAGVASAAASSNTDWGNMGSWGGI